MHHKDEICDSNDTTVLEDMLLSAKDLMFPETLLVSTDEAPVKFHLKENGGWSDLRDISLCLSMCMT
jgi:N-acetylglucosaminyltransferase II (MGAT2)